MINFINSGIFLSTYTMGLTEITVPQVFMLLIGLFFVYLAVAKKYEPLLLLPLAFGIIIANIPGANLSAYDFFVSNDPLTGDPVERLGLLHFLYGGIINVIYPPLIFLCIGSMTDFGPLISNPRTALIGLGGQLGIFVAFAGALVLLGKGAWLTSIIPGFDGFSAAQAASIGIIGSSDGPTSIFAASRMAPEILSTVAIAAFSYMALVPFIQPPIMRWLTNDTERKVVMPAPKNVSQRQKILFPVVLTLVVLLLVPAAGALIGMFMLGNLIRESGVTGRYLETLQNAFLNILTLLVALSIGSSARADYFLTTTTIIVIVLGLIAFAFGTIGGVLIAKLLYKVTGGKINPLIGNSGVSAMPMAARISQKLGQEYNSQNHLLMHAMGPIVSSTIFSAVVAGIFIALYS
ncbi:MAG: sodium ion-translocating decarboxylase subunit beta [Bacteroidales bacterium]|jgi:oxaloacetate decarboxylase beta subunit|nr:sodium ion-translocating decarboxylase subunit beta [Bacteroidales bacterium]